MSLRITGSMKEAQRVTSAAIRKLRKVSNADFETLARRAGQIGLAASIRVTPPFKKLRTKGRLVVVNKKGARLSGVKKKQDFATGVGAIERDIGKTHRPLNDPLLFKSKELKARVAAATSNTKKQQILRGAGWGGVVVQSTFNESRHNQSRNKEGRVGGYRNVAQPTYVPDDSAQRDGLETKSKRVGFTVSGWAKGARKLIILLPGWAKQAAPGSYTEKFGGGNKFISIRNNVRWFSGKKAKRAERVGTVHAALAMKTLARHVERAFNRTGDIQKVKSVF